MLQAVSEANLGRKLSPNKPLPVSRSIARRLAVTASLHRDTGCIMVVFLLVPDSDRTTAVAVAFALARLNLLDDCHRRNLSDTDQYSEPPSSSE